ncbi:hypothetical protein EGH21_05780 [Halomicroarcula sp. F13]|uniref:Uncharacterized protein n=1 Tax=Haloarcula rubra TaxID=2487747 RepID=A0AAW4PNC8_9EURY|nr:hypothetical protein [Halomicroarcula rubra]MBX0322533.1 hypothetical protein [Halomicroarcula rubra]
MTHRDYGQTGAHLDEWASLLGTDIAEESRDHTDETDVLEEQSEHV